MLFVALAVILLEAPDSTDNKQSLRVVNEGFHNDIDETSVSTGYMHTCAIEHDGKEFGGTPVCWGNNDHGQASAPKVKVSSLIVVF